MAGCINGFADMRGWLWLQAEYRTEFRGIETFELPAGGPTRQMRTASPTGVNFVARKTPDSTTDKVPVQAYYSRLFSGRAADPSQGRSSFKRKVKSLLPDPVLDFLACTVVVNHPKNRLPNIIKEFFYRYWPGVDEARRPWGLKREWLSP